MVYEKVFLYKKDEIMTLTAIYREQNRIMQHALKVQ
jgi:hypothetical protein